MATHTLSPTSTNVHGAFSRELAPVLTVASGDTIVARTLDAGWGLEAPKADLGPRQKLESADPDQPRGHALLGPIAVPGAEPGMGLVIDIDEITVGGWGWTVAGGWEHPVNRALQVREGEYSLHWHFDRTRNVALNQFGDAVALRPFLGIMGNAPAEPGWHSTVPPRNVGGNLDCRELVAGSRLVLPIEVPEALFSFGDGHAAQGDGESSVTAIECPLERVVLRLSLERQPLLPTPYAETPAGWLTFGLHEDLTEAAHRALDAMLTLLQHLRGLDRRRALALASVTVDLRITQIVNQVRGVHALISHDVLAKLGTPKTRYWVKCFTQSGT